MCDSILLSCSLLSRTVPIVWEIIPERYGLPVAIYLNDIAAAVLNVDSNDFCARPQRWFSEIWSEKRHKGSTVPVLVNFFDPKLWFVFQ